MRLGWLLLPGHLAGAISEEKTCADLGTGVPAQLALADFIQAGELDRHLRRTRRTYRARRAALIEAVHNYLPDTQIQGVAAGLHALALLPAETNEAALTTAAAARGVSVYGLSRHRARPAAGPPGLILGYANLPETTINAASASSPQHARQPDPPGSPPSTGGSPTGSSPVSSSPPAPWRIRLYDELRAKVTEHAPEGWLPLRQAAAALGVAGRPFCIRSIAGPQTRTAADGPR